MNRLHGSGFTEAIETTRSLMTPRLAERLAGVGFVCGVRPSFIGLIRGSYAFANGQTVDYDNLACTAYGRWHTPDKQTTIVYPRLDLYRDPVATFAHEFGHALHETVDFVRLGEITTEYSRQSAHEEFAEAFERWLLGNTDWLPARAPRSVALFEALSA